MKLLRKITLPLLRHEHLRLDLLKFLIRLFTPFFTYNGLIELGVH